MIFLFFVSSPPRILEHFNTGPEKYSLVFTSGATGALKTVAECFAWHDEDRLKDAVGENGEVTTFLVIKLRLSVNKDVQNIKKNS